MKNLIKTEKGQSFVELALVVFLFTVFCIGVLQIVMLGNARIKCEMAARRVAWVEGTFNNLSLNRKGGGTYEDDIKMILGSNTIDHTADGDRKNGVRKITLTYHVPAIGFFQLLKPNGFDISTTSAVIAYNEQPFVAKGVDAIAEWFLNLFK